ncbi:Light-harvesting complex [Amphidinium carterae]
MMLMLLPRASPSLASSALPHSRANGPLAMPKFDRVSTLAILSGSVAVAAAQRKCKSPAGNLLRSRAQGNDVGTEQSFDPTVQIGAMAPLGYFDPVGFCSDASEDRFKYLRAAELKHGRVAMLAALGLVVQHDVRFEGYSAIPSGIWAVQQAPALYGSTALVLLCGILELQIWAQNPNDEPGNFGDPLGLGMYDDDMRNKELANGRFAMIATAGIIAAEVVTGQDAVQQLVRLQQSL